VAFHNPILAWSGHPYARSLLSSSRTEVEALVEGGDPMNGPYMMLSPEIRSAGTGWDRIFLNSVQGRDVQLRFLWETRATYEEIRRRLDQGGTVRLKGMAAGTGLSMIVAYDRLVREGYDAGRMMVRITDRERANTEKTNRLLAKLASTRGRKPGADDDRGIVAQTEDVFEVGPAIDRAGDSNYDVVTAVGILEYLQGFTCATTESRLNLPEGEEAATAMHLAARLGKITTDAAALIVNTYRPHASSRILELLGKRFDYRNRENLSALLAAADFRAPRLIGSGNIYDIEVYEKNCLDRLVSSS